jgi:hypothetical protein
MASICKDAKKMYLLFTDILFFGKSDERNPNWITTDSVRDTPSEYRFRSIPSEKNTPDYRLRPILPEIITPDYRIRPILSEITPPEYQFRPILPEIIIPERRFRAILSEIITPEGRFRPILPEIFIQECRVGSFLPELSTPCNQLIPILSETGLLGRNFRQFKYKDNKYTKKQIYNSTIISDNKFKIKEHEEIFIDTGTLSL